MKTLFRDLALRLRGPEVGHEFDPCNTAAAHRGVPGEVAFRSKAVIVPALSEGVFGRALWVAAFPPLSTACCPEYLVDVGEWVEAGDPLYRYHVYLGPGRRNLFYLPVRAHVSGYVVSRLFGRDTSRNVDCTSSDPYAKLRSCEPYEQGTMAIVPSVGDRLPESAAAAFQDFVALYLKHQARLSRHWGMPSASSPNEIRAALRAPVLTQPLSVFAEVIDSLEQKGTRADIVQALQNAVARS
ncbi:MAG: hypothetical protein AAGI01_11880 [Myxococcota bacterium]